MKNSYGDLTGFGADIQGKIVDREAQLEEKKIAVGVLGKIFGCSENSSKNIAGLVIALSFIIPALISWLSTPDPGHSRFECWNIFTPLISGSLGYLFGKSSFKDSKNERDN